MSWSNGQIAIAVKLNSQGNFRVDISLDQVQGSVSEIGSFDLAFSLKSSPFSYLSNSLLTPDGLTVLSNSIEPGLILVAGFAFPALLDTGQPFLSFTLNAPIGDTQGEIIFEELRLNGFNTEPMNLNLFRADSLGGVARGGTDADLMFGRLGSDVLNGGGGNDTLYGGAGNDNLIGGSGRDLVEGGSGSDTLGKI